MNVVCAGRRTRTLFQKMIRIILVTAAVMFSSVLGYHFGQQETELRWTQEREQLLTHQIETLHRKDKEIAQLEKSIGVLNDSALRVRERDAQIQRRLQRELGECDRFRRALELSSKTLAEAQSAIDESLKDVPSNSDNGHPRGLKDNPESFR